MSHETVAQLRAFKEKVASAREDWGTYAVWHEYSTAKVANDGRLKSKNVSIRIKALEALREELQYRVQFLSDHGCVIHDEFWLGSIEDLISQHLPSHSNGTEMAEALLHRGLTSVEAFLSRTHLFVNFCEDKRAKILSTFADAADFQLKMCEMREVSFLADLTVEYEEHLHEYADMIEKICKAEVTGSQLFGVLNRQTATTLQTASMYGIKLARQSILDEFFNVPEYNYSLLWERARDPALVAIHRLGEDDQSKPFPGDQKRLTDFYTMEVNPDNSACSRTKCKQSTEHNKPKPPKVAIRHPGKRLGPLRLYTRQLALCNFIDCPHYEVYVEDLKRAEALLADDPELHNQEIDTSDAAEVDVEIDA